MARPKRVVNTHTWKQNDNNYNSSNAASDNTTSDNNAIAASEGASNENEKGHEAVDAASNTVITTSDDNVIAASEAEEPCDENKNEHDQAKVIAEENIIAEENENEQEAIGVDRDEVIAAVAESEGYGSKEDQILYNDPPLVNSNNDTAIAASTTTNSVNNTTSSIRAVIPNNEAVAAANTEHTTISNNMAVAAANTDQTTLNNDASESQSHDLWWPEIKELEKQNLVILGTEEDKIIDTKDGTEFEIGRAVICIICRDGQGKSNGIIRFIKKKYHKYKFDEHCRCDKHKAAVARHKHLEELVKKGKAKRKVATTMQGYFNVVPAKKKRKINNTEADGGDSTKKDEPPVMDVTMK